ncbi:hypothetical protein AA313_de0203890 [Arthrobotrys entomopaga]|nr:hypothetical protein AA313_de0203890 [Arthrobotrys entomopaga]
MSGVEFIAVTSIIASIIGIIDGVNQVVQAASDVEGLPKVFRHASQKLPIISDILRTTKRTLEKHKGSEVEESVKGVVDNCENDWKKLKDLFDAVVPERGAPRTDRYYKAVKTLGKGGKVEKLMKELLESVQLLAAFKIITMSKEEKEVETNIDTEKVVEAIADVERWEPSVPDSVFEEKKGTHIMTVTGSGYMAAQGDHSEFTSISGQGRNIKTGRDYIENSTGGMGKTQLATEYAYRYKSKYDAVFWLFAATESSIQASLKSALERIIKDLKKKTALPYSHLASELGVQGIIGNDGTVSNDPEKAGDIRSAFFDWLHQTDNSKWLLVYDNMDDLEAFNVQEYLPKQGGGAVLITSRRPNFRSIAKQDEIGGLDKNDAIALLRTLIATITGILSIQAFSYYHSNGGL